MKKSLLIYAILAIVCIILLLAVISIELIIFDIKLDGTIYMTNAAFIIPILAKLKKTLSLKIKDSPKSSKQLNKILRKGFALYGKDTMNKLYSIATENEDEAIKWMNDNKSKRDALNKKLMYYELTPSEKTTMQQEFDTLNTQSDIVLQIRSCRRNGCNVQEVYERIKNETL